MNVLKNQYLRGLNIESVAQVIESVSGGVNGGCNLYIGSSTTDNILVVKNISGDVVQFKNIVQGTILPFSVTEIVSLSGVAKLVALW